MNIRKTCFWTGLLGSSIHFVFLWFAIGWTFSKTMERFDLLTNAEPGFLEKLLAFLISILGQPALLLAQWFLFPDWIEWVLFISNSLLWGYGIACSSRVLYKRFRSPDKA